MESAWRRPATGGVARLDGRVGHPVRRDDRPREEARRVEHPGEVDWNAELVRGDLEQAVQRLKEEPGRDCSSAA